MVRCRLCEDKGAHPFCKSCFKKEDRELVYLPAFPVEPKKRKKKRKSVEQILEERRLAPSPAEQNLIEVREEAEKQRRASYAKWMTQLETFQSPTTGSEDVDIELRRLYGNKRFEPLEQSLKRQLALAIKGQNKDLENKLRSDETLVQRVKDRINASLS